MATNKAGQAKAWHKDHLKRLLDIQRILIYERRTIFEDEEGERIRSIFNGVEEVFFDIFWFNFKKSLIFFIK